MKSEKNIDRIFQEKFKDFDVQPNDRVWQRIEESLPQKKKRRVVPLWWQMAGVAAVIALLITFGYRFFNNDAEHPNSNTLPVVERENLQKKNHKKDEESTTINYPSNVVITDVGDSTTQDNLDQDGTTSTNVGKSDEALKLKNSNRKAIVNQQTTKALPQNDTDTNSINLNQNDKDADFALNTPNNRTEDKQNNFKSVLNTSIETLAFEDDKAIDFIDTVATNKTLEAYNNILILETDKTSIEEAIASQDDINEKEKEELSRWSIAPTVAPVYFSSLGEGSSLHMQFNENTKSSNVNMSFGIAGTYAVTNRLKIRTGVNRVDLNYSTTDVFAFTGGELASRGVEGQLGNIRFNEAGGNITFISAKMLNMASTPEIFNTKVTGDIEQRFGFIEVPLELEYRLVDQKFGVNVIGGFSTFLLNNNEIYADIDGISTLIGESNNLNNTSFSANFGIGLDYNLSKKWNVMLEPTFKYQLNTFSNTTGDFRPYIFGVYSGIRFKF